MNEKIADRPKTFIEKILKTKFMNWSINLLEKMFKTKITTLIAELFKTAAVGGLGVVVNMSLFFLFTVLNAKIFNLTGAEEKIYLITCQVFIHIILITMSFFMQKYFTFKKVDNTKEQLVKFILQSISYFLFDTLFTIGFNEWLKIPKMISKLISVFILFFYSFLTQKLWIFKR
ncbi:MAG: GtrA family protein [Spirochaetes bacterium]|nr:GtrA family protein [Spirochaetota bacterium]